jgi:hypothetical protein
MESPIKAIVFFIFLLRPALSHGTADNQRCVASIYEAYSYISFEGFGYGKYWNATCQNHLKVTSIYAASTKYCTPGDKTAGISLLSFYCQEYGHTVLLDESELAANLTIDKIEKMKLVTLDEKSAKVNYTEPVVISREFYDLSYQTLVRVFIDDVTIFYYTAT